MRARLLLLALAWGCGACATLPLAPGGSLPPGQGAVPPISLSSPRPTPTLLSPGDRITVELSSVETKKLDGLIVDGRGEVHVPGVGDVRVGGLAIDAAERAITARLVKRDRLGRALVLLDRPDGQQVTFVGALSQPARVQLHPGMRLSEAFGVAAPGGLSEQGAGPVPDLSRARLVRGGEVHELDLRLALAGDTAHDVWLSPGDLVVVPERPRRVTILGQVAQPVVLAHRPGLRLTEALANAGGVTPDGDRADVRIVRGASAEPVVYRADLRAIADGERADVAIADGDVLYVPDHALENVRELLGVTITVVGVGLLAGALTLTQQGR